MMLKYQKGSEKYLNKPKGNQNVQYITKSQLSNKMATIKFTQFWFLSTGLSKKHNARNISFLGQRVSKSVVIISFIGENQSHSPKILQNLFSRNVKKINTYKQRNYPFLPYTYCTVITNKPKNQTKAALGTSSGSPHLQHKDEYIPHVLYSPLTFLNTLFQIFSSCSCLLHFVRYT